MNSILSEKFTQIYTDNLWNSNESRSGTGSELESTKILRAELVYMFQKYNIRSMLDIPCGDWNWMKLVDLSKIRYIGADIVPAMIIANREAYPGVDFRLIDITCDELPTADLIFCKDIFCHLSDINIHKSLDNIRRSGSKYLMTTSYTKINQNCNIGDSQWKVINMMIHPYLLKPIYLINVDCHELYPKHNDKCMILVKIDDMYSA